MGRGAQGMRPDSKPEGDLVTDFTDPTSPDYRPKHTAEKRMPPPDAGEPISEEELAEVEARAAEEAPDAGDRP